MTSRWRRTASIASADSVRATMVTVEPDERISRSTVPRSGGSRRISRVRCADGAAQARRFGSDDRRQPGRCRQLATDHARVGERLGGRGRSGDGAVAGVGCERPPRRRASATQLSVSVWSRPPAASRPAQGPVVADRRLRRSRAEARTQWSGTRSSGQRWSGTRWPGQRLRWSWVRGGQPLWSRSRPPPATQREAVGGVVGGPAAEDAAAGAEAGPDVGLGCTSDPRAGAVGKSPGPLPSAVGGVESVARRAAAAVAGAGSGNRGRAASPSIATAPWAAGGAVVSSAPVGGSAPADASAATAAAPSAAPVGSVGGVAGAEAASGTRDPAASVGDSVWSAGRAGAASTSRPVVTLVAASVARVLGPVDPAMVLGAGEGQLGGHGRRHLGGRRAGVG